MKTQVKKAYTLFKLIAGLCIVMTYNSCDFSAEHNGEIGSGSFSNISGSIDTVIPSDVQQVFESRCAQCHANGQARGGFGSLYDVAAMVQLGYLVPGNPLQSSVYTEIDDGTMPLSGALPANEAQVVSDWIAALGSASGGGSGSGNQVDTFAEVYSQVIQPKCLQCHSGSAAQGGSVKLETYADVAYWVVSGFPEYSRLYTLAESGEMPKNNNKVTVDELGLLRRWIASGAEDN